MKDIGIRNTNADLGSLGILNYKRAFWNLTAEQLIEETIKREQGVLSDTGAISVKTGEFTGRSPKDRFIVKDDLTENSVDWGDINIPFEKKNFDSLYSQITEYFSDKDLFIKDAYACSDPQYQLNVRLIAEYPWSAHFVNNMFLRLTQEELKSFEADWTILCAPGCFADPAKDGTRQHNFAIVNFKEQKIIIGGTGYTGEIKKGIFSVLNYILPKNHDVLAMHCSANAGESGDTAVFFGLSGTGKTTLSADPKRFLIGDDEHGWSANSVFNFEGGCYAKTIDLTEEKEPDIYRAIKHGAILENIVFKENTRTPDYEDASITQNTRVSYPIYHIENALEGSTGGIPKNIFFLTADAFGVLPPISKLDAGQAMYHFISGYTAKVAGTEEGINEPVATFSACFGSPFLPLHPTFYAEMLGKKMEQYNVNLWLVNTGWTGGPYGIGSRIKLKYTRAMITAALNGELDHDDYSNVDIFKLNVPNVCPGVPSEILNTKNTWEDKAAFEKKANDLANRFINNFKKFESEANATIMAAAPELSQPVI
jgi:phosphoenolpyruvate carboxykinase (ATP)